MGAGEDESLEGNKVRSARRPYIWTRGVCTWTWGKYGAVWNCEARNWVTWLDLSFKRSQTAMWRKKAWGGVGRDRVSWLKGSWVVYAVAFVTLVSTRTPGCPRRLNIQNVKAGHRWTVSYSPSPLHSFQILLIWYSDKRVMRVKQRNLQV